jgi:hypothetical protein
VTSSGGAMACFASDVVNAPTVSAARKAVEARMDALVRETLATGGGPYAGAVAIAHRFLRTWLPAEELPAGPPLSG